MNPGDLDLGIVSDELTLDFREAVSHALPWGITRYEIRCLKSGRIPAIDPVEWADVLACIRERGVTVTALSPGIFKHPLSARAELENELAVTLPRTIAMGRESGTSLIIVFGLKREVDEPASNYMVAVDLLRRAAALAEREGIRIAIENEPGFWCDTGENTRRIITDVGSPALGANWDPANAIGCTEVPYPDGYEAVKPVIMNVHVKDTVRGALVQCVPIGEGLIDWPGQLRALVRDGVVPHVTIETHCHPLIETSRRNVDTIHRLLSEQSPTTR